MRNAEKRVSLDLVYQDSKKNTLTIYPLADEDGKVIIYAVKKRRGKRSDKVTNDICV